MQFDTYLFGKIEVSAEKIINFPKGLVGFERNVRYTLVHEAAGDTPVSFTLQSLDDPMLAFQIVDPTTLGFNYELALTDAESELLGQPAPEDVAVMQLIFRKEEGSNTSIAPSLRAPLVINTKARVGLQKVMESLRSNITLSNLASEI